MEGSEEQHSARVGDRKGDEPCDLGLPVVQNVLRESVVQIVRHEAAHHCDLNDEEVDDVADADKGLVLWRETEAHRNLREQQEAEVLEVSIEEHGAEKDKRAEALDELSNVVFFETDKDNSEQKEGNKDEDKVESQELPAGRKKGFSSVLHSPESGICVLYLGVYERVNLLSTGAYFCVKLVGLILADQTPLLVLETLEFLEELIHGVAVVSFVIHVEPELVDADEVAENPEDFPASRNLVEDLEQVVRDEG